MRDDRIHDAGRLMDAFAVRTWIGSAGDPARRYLWTDAYAVMAWLGLWRATGDELHRDRALRTVDLVHHHLGRHRPARGKIHHHRLQHSIILSLATNTHPHLYRRTLFRRRLVDRHRLHPLLDRGQHMDHSHHPDNLVVLD
jgi:hypothetical protein